MNAQGDSGQATLELIGAWWQALLVISCLGEQEEHSCPPSAFLPSQQWSQDTLKWPSSIWVPLRCF